VRLLQSLVSLPENTIVRCAGQALDACLLKFRKHLHRQIWGTT